MQVHINYELTNGWWALEIPDHGGRIRASSQPDSSLCYTARSQFKSPKTDKALIFLARKRMFLFYHYVHNVLFISEIGTAEKAMGHRGPEMGRPREQHGARERGLLHVCTQCACPSLALPRSVSSVLEAVDGCVRANASWDLGDP